MKNIVQSNIVNTKISPVAMFYKNIEKQKIEEQQKIDIIKKKRNTVKYIN